MILTHEKTSPPFLNSFNCSATILSYVGRTTKVIPLLNALSKSTSRYLVAHAPYLSQFLKGPSIPSASCVIKFGLFDQGDLPHNWQLKALTGKPLVLSRFRRLKYYKTFDVQHAA